MRRRALRPDAVVLCGRGGRFVSEPGLPGFVLDLQPVRAAFQVVAGGLRCRRGSHERTQQNDGSFSAFALPVSNSADF